MSLEKIKQSLEQTLQNRPYILRIDPFRQQLDGLSPGVIANMDSAGTGPEGMFYVGRKAAYEISQYIEWLVGRMASHRKEVS